MQKLNKMYLRLLMDRYINPNEHYISPGGYEFNGKNFDFCESSGSILKDTPDQVEFWFREFDDSPGDDGNPVIITPEDIKGDVTEFYIYTGEPDEPEINVKEVLEISFEFYDDEKDKYFDIDGDKELLAKINKEVAV